MDGIANAAQSATGANYSARGRNEVSTGTAGGLGQAAVPPPGNQGHSPFARRRCASWPGAVGVGKPLRGRLATTLQATKGLVECSLAQTRQASRPTPRKLVHEIQGAVPLSTSAPHAIAGAVASREIPVIEAERVGMSTQRLKRVAELNQRYVDQGKIPGIATAVLRDGKLVHQSVAGTRSTVDSTPLPVNGLFRLYSMTRPVTAMAAMQLYEQGKFQLSDSVAKYVPEFKEMTVFKDGEPVKATRKMTMHHLMTHTAGFALGGDPREPADKAVLKAHLLESKNLDQYAAKLASIPLRHEPGTQWQYSLSDDVLALVIERLSGQPLDKYFASNIFEPLGMVDTGFNVPEEKADRLLPQHFRDRTTRKPHLLDDAESIKALGAVPFEVQIARHNYRDTSLYSGNFGLVSTLRDYARFAEAVRGGGELYGKRVLGPKAASFMMTNQLPAVLPGGAAGRPLVGAGLPIHGAGYGFGGAVLLDPAANGVMGTPGQYYWDGMGGTSFFIDPKERMVVVSLMHLMNPWSSYPKDLRVAAYQAITDSTA